MTTDAQTEARASLWVPAKPEHANLGWTYDFEQTERISRAACDSTGYDATMEVVEFVMAEADRRLATALAAKDAELSAKDANIKALGEQMVAERLRVYELQELLADPNAVHLNMLRGDIASPTIDQITHIYTEIGAVLTAGNELIAALARHGFPVSDAAEPALLDGGSREAKALHHSAKAFTAAFRALSHEGERKG